jgi:hypothetical protein
MLLTDQRKSFLGPINVSQMLVWMLLENVKGKTLRDPTQLIGYHHQYYTPINLYCSIYILAALS